MSKVAQGRRFPKRRKLRRHWHSVFPFLYHEIIRAITFPCPVDNFTVARRRGTKKAERGRRWLGRREPRRARTGRAGYRGARQERQGEEGGQSRRWAAPDGLARNVDLISQHPLTQPACSGPSPSAEAVPVSPSRVKHPWLDPTRCRVILLH